MSLEKKFDRLQSTLKEMDRVIIAFSGGVDSTFLLKTASISGLSDILAVTGQSDSIPGEELAFAKEMTESLNVRHLVIATHELENKKYSMNPPDRCYYCKKELFSKLSVLAQKEHYPFVLDGTNADDARDWRPGTKAAQEESVKSPLLDAGLGKTDIRTLSKGLGLPTWNKPATPCLSSRFPYGQEITTESLIRVGKAETFLKHLGISELRVRNHGELARIEVHPGQFTVLMEQSVRARTVEYFKTLGFNHITLDMQGFRSGSSNELINTDRE